MHASTAKNPRNLSTLWSIEIFLVLGSAYIVPRDQDMFVFYVNKNIDWNFFNQLYDPNWIEIGIRNANVVIYKLELASTRATNQGLKIAKEERRKREEMVKRRKTEIMVTKCPRTKEGISLSSKEKGNYESNTKNKTNQN